MARISLHHSKRLTLHKLTQLADMALQAHWVKRIDRELIGEENFWSADIGTQTVGNYQLLFINTAAVQAIAQVV